MSIRPVTLFASIFLLLGSLTAFAHHPFASEFDPQKPLTLNGTVAKVDWGVPHAYIYLDVKNSSGKAEQWKLETANPDFLTKHGLKANSFKAGDKLTVKAYAATKGEHLASARTLTLADGHSMPVADPAEDGGPAN